MGSVSVSSSDRGFIVNQNMKWFAGTAAIMAMAFVIGCGGSGSSSTSTSATSGTTGRAGGSIATVNLANTGANITVTYLSGQGRAAGDLLAHIGLVEYLGANANAESSLADGINLMLNGYTANQITIDQPIAASENSQQYNQFHLQVQYLEQENSDGSFGAPITGPSGFAVDQLFDASIGAFPGRYTAVQSYLDDAEITVSNGAPVFNRTLYLQNNTSAINPNIQGFLSDYVMFDISNASVKPSLDDGTVANRIYFSGDQIAISGPNPGFQTTTSAGEFQVFTPGLSVIGNYSLPVAPINTGTYTLKQINPTDLTHTATITALSGIWRPVTQVFNNLGPFEVLLFPHSNDSNEQDAVAFTETSTGQITSLYYGIADLTGDTIKMWPLSDLSAGTVTGEIDGTLSALEDNTGATVTAAPAVRQGTYSFTGTLPSGWDTTGRFVVFRI